MCATNRPHACLRQAKVLYLALLNQVFHRTGHVLNRHTWINAVLIKKVNHIGPEPFQRCIGHLFDVLGPAVQAGTFSVFIDFEAKLCRDDDLVEERLESFADKFFIRVGAVDLSRIEECHAAFDGGANERDPLLLLSCRAVAKAQAHATESQRRYLKPAVS